MGRQQPIATQFPRFGIILVFVIIIIISSVYVYVYRCKIGNKNSLHFTSSFTHRLSSDMFGSTSGLIRPDIGNYIATELETWRLGLSAYGPECTVPDGPGSACYQPPGL